MSEEVTQLPQDTVTVDRAALIEAMVQAYALLGPKYIGKPGSPAYAWAEAALAKVTVQSKDVPGPVEPTSSGGSYSPCAEAGTSAGHLRQGDTVFIPATVQYLEENGLYVMVGIPMHGFSFAEDKTWILPVAVDPAVLKTVNP